MYVSQQIARQIDDRPSLTVILLAAWVIASAAFGTNFYSLRFSGFVDITLERVLFVVIVLCVIGGLFQGKVNLQRNSAIEIAMGVFILVCLFSMSQTGFVPISPIFISPWFIFINGYLFPFIIFMFAKSYVREEKDVLVILNTLFYFGIYLCITSFFEFTDLKQFVFPRYIANPDVGIHVDRARGPFLNSAFNGVGIIIGFISGLHLLQRRTGFSRFFHQAALLLFFPAVFFTLTRAVYLSMLVTVVIFLGWYKTSFPKWKLLSLPLAIILIVAIANYPRFLSTERREGGVYQTEEVSVRLALLERSISLFSESPVTGVGLAQFSPSSVYSQTGRVSPILIDARATLQHSHLLGMLTELGLAGVLTYLTIIVCILRRIKQIAGKLPETGIMGSNLRIVIFSIWSVYLITNLFLEPTSNLFDNAVPFLFAGLADGMYARSLESRLATSPSYISRSPMRIIGSHV